MTTFNDLTALCGHFRFRQSASGTHYYFLREGTSENIELISASDSSINFAFIIGDTALGLLETRSFTSDRAVSLFDMNFVTDEDDEIPVGKFSIDHYQSEKWGFGTFESTNVNFLVKWDQTSKYFDFFISYLKSIEDLMSLHKRGKLDREMKLLLDELDVPVL